MLFKDSKIKPVDNTGAKLVKCIRIVHKTKKYGTVGDLLAVIVKKFKKKKKLIKKTIYYGLLISIKAPIIRLDGTWIKSNKNRVVLISSDKKLQFLGTRIYGPIYKEIRNLKVGFGRHRRWKYDKIVSYARKVI